MIIAMQSYISHPRGTVFYHLINFFIIKIFPYSFVAKNIGNYRKYDIFFNFRFTGNMVFPSIAEYQENKIFTLSVFTKMLFFMQCTLKLASAIFWQIFIFHQMIVLQKL